jgi:hypothetical protein
MFAYLVAFKARCRGTFPEQELLSGIHTEAPKEICALSKERLVGLACAAFPTFVTSER